MLTLYVRDGCHLCEEMERALLAREIPFECIAIGWQGALAERYGHKVPVLCDRDEEICHHFFDAQALSRFSQSRG